MSDRMARRPAGAPREPRSAPRPAHARDALLLAAVVASALALSAPAALAATPPASGVDPEAHRDRGEVLGRWEGTSICVKAPWNAACHDEVVRYDFVPLDSDSVAVRLRAYKLVNGEYDWMGDLDFRPDTTAGRWVCDFAARRGPIRWTCDVTDSALTATVMDMESRRIGRNARAHRVPAGTRR